jgi:hypothetical protein
VIGVERRQHDDRGRLRPGPDGRRRLKPVEAGHADVHQHDVGPVPLHAVHRGLTVTGLVDDGQVVGRLQDHPQTGPDQCLVVGEQY